MQILPTTFLRHAALACALAAGAAGCASMRLADAQAAYHHEQLDSWRYAAGCLDVWPAVLKLVGGKGYPLQGRDRQYAAQGKESGLAALVDQGDETQAVAGGGLFVRTGWLDDSDGASRYEVSGTPAQPSGCVVSFTRVSRGTVDPATMQRAIDWRMQLELLRQLDPAAAARVEAGVPKS